MNIPKYSLENRKVIYFFLAILLIGGVISFFKLPKKEDAPFVIKTAVLVTQYPGANPHEVEKLITEPIEREIQSMTDVYQIKSECIRKANFRVAIDCVNSVGGIILPELLERLGVKHVEKLYCEATGDFHVCWS